MADLHLADPPGGDAPEEPLVERLSNLNLERGPLAERFDLEALPFRPHPHNGFEFTEAFLEAAKELEQQIPEELRIDVPPPIKVKEGGSPIVVVDPHGSGFIPRGFKVPESLFGKKHASDDVFYINGNPLGIPAEAFHELWGAHEIVDRGIRAHTRRVFEIMSHDGRPPELMPTFTWGGVSRAGRELNRESRFGVPILSTEYPDIVIPANIAITPEQFALREFLFAQPYFKRLREIFAAKLEGFDAVPVMDNHSCTFNWRGQDRIQKVGSLTEFESFVTETNEAAYKDRFGEDFSPNFPYNPNEAPDMSIMPSLVEEFSGRLLPAGVELRQDCLTSDPEFQERAARATIKSIDDIHRRILDHPWLENHGKPFSLGAPDDIAAKGPA